jgi:hypothetical protein
VADQRDAEILEILGRQARQDRRVDLVVAERRCVLFEPGLRSQPPTSIRLFSLASRRLTIPH